MPATSFALYRRMMVVVGNLAVGGQSGLRVEVDVQHVSILHRKKPAIVPWGNGALPGAGLGNQSGSKRPFFVIGEV